MGGYTRPHIQPQFVGGYSQPFSPIRTPSILSQGEAFYQAYGTTLEDPFTPVSDPAFGDPGASSSRPPRYPTPVTLPPPPPPGLAPGREPRQPPGAAWDFSPHAGWYRRDGQQ